MANTASHFTETGELIKLYCASHLKYHLGESESYQELHLFRE